MSYDWDSVERKGETSAGMTVTHGQQIKDLPEAIQLPSETSVIYIKAHTNRQDMITKGNFLADQAARAAAWQTVTVMLLVKHELISEIGKKL